MQLETYLTELTLDFDFWSKWKCQSGRRIRIGVFQILLARYLLSILITAIASKSTFNIGSQILNKYMNRPLPNNVETIICTFSWKHEFSETN